jgi:protein involved in polysaccharide export with SLBB domain
MQFPIRILALPAAIALLAGCAANELPLSMMGEPAAGAYHLRPGDTVLLEVFQEPYMTTRQPILEDGTIAVGLIGRIAIAGETVAGASDKIAARLDEKHLVNPQVVLTVENYAPRRFVVWGQVRNPGSFLIPGAETITLPAAIAMAGGNTDIGDLRNVTVTRGGAASGSRIKFNALSPRAEHFVVQEGDVIRVAETIF